MKKCSKCGIVKPSLEFRGLRCRSCRSEYDMHRLKTNTSARQLYLISKKKYYINNKDKILAYNTSNRNKLKAEVINHYSNGLNCCACCKESDIRFLSIDHINNNGAEHRKSMRKSICRWLRRNNYPIGYQVLCFNCNLGKSINKGICPHHQPPSHSNSIIDSDIQNLL